MLPIYHDKDGEEVAMPEGEEIKPGFKNKLLEAMEANLKSAEVEELAMGDVEEAERIKNEETGIEKEKGGE